MCSNSCHQNWYRPHFWVSVRCPNILMTIYWEDLPQTFSPISINIVLFSRRICPHWPRLAQTTLYRIKERRKTRWWKSGSLHDALCHLEELICITVICVAVTWFGRGKFDPIILMRTESHLSQRKIYSTFEYSTKYQNFDFILVDNINYYEDSLVN